MAAIEDRYISLLTDFGFKRIFGTAPNKDLLINFLNCLFAGRKVIKNIMYLNGEHFGEIQSARKAIFDVYCEDENGKKFIVEMQNAYQEFFKDRALFYSTFPIREQAKKGSDWDFNLTNIYTVALLNFGLKDEAFDADKICHTVKLCDIETNKVFYHKLDFIYVEIAKFKKTEDELETLYDKWLYVLKNLSKLDNRPKALVDKVFDRLFEEAEIARFTPTELREYEESLKAYRDIKNSLDTAKREGVAEGVEIGREEGRAEGRAEGEQSKAIDIAKNLKSMGLSIANIIKATGLSEDDIMKL